MRGPNAVVVAVVVHDMRGSRRRVYRVLRHGVFVGEYAGADLADKAGFELACLGLGRRGAGLWRLRPVSGSRPANAARSR